MKKLIYIALTVLTLTACEDFTSQVDELEVRINQLEKTCAQFNEEVNSLNTLIEALQSNNYITSVEPVKEGDQILGYKINFIQGEPTYIMNGKDGLNGKAPAIGVKKDQDGKYYWTLDGKFMKDSAGNPILAEGENGKDAITPQLKLEDEWWYISYDEGQTWTYLGPASWKAGNSIFSNVEVKGRTVYFTLADGSVIRIPLYQEIGITLFDTEGKRLDETVPVLIPIKNTLVIQYEIDANDGNYLNVRVSTSGKYVVDVQHDYQNNNGKIYITAPKTDAGAGSVNLIIEDNGYLYSKKIQVGCIVPKSISYTISGLSASTYQVESWTLTLVEDLLHPDRYWIDGIIPEMEGIAGFYGLIERDTDGALTKLSLPIGQINTELDPDFVNYPEDGIIRLYGIDDYGSTVENGEIVFEFTNGGKNFTLPGNGPAVGGISKYGYPMFYNGFFGGDFGAIEGSIQE